MKLLTEFLADDKEKVRINGGIIDITGFDGLPKTEIINPVGTEERFQQRARSSAKIYLKYKGNDCDPYAATRDKETYDNWLIYDVICMNDIDHTIIKVCIPEDEKFMATAVNKNSKCNKKIDDLMSDKEYAMQPSALILNKFKHNNIIKKIKNKYYNKTNYFNNNNKRNK